MQPVTSSDLDLLKASLIDPSFVFLDGFHAVKHAARFGADVRLVACASQAKLEEFANALAPDVAETLVATARSIRKQDVRALGPRRSHWTGVWGVASRPRYTLDQILRSPRPVVLIENPMNQGNLGACIRVAAAANAAGVIAIGDADPWAAAVVRGAAGLQFAIPVVALPTLPDLDRPIVAIDPEGQDISSATLPERPILAFGTERQGLSPQLLAQATTRASLPMQPGVSSINLAVAVGITLYSPAIR